MKKIIFTFFAACFATAMFAGIVNYTADNTTIFPNPERGFLTQLTRHANADTYYAVKGKESYLTNHKNDDKGTLILVLYYLDEFNATNTLPEAVLTAFDEDMAVLRNYGMKAIFRLAYAETSYGKDKTETPKSAHDAPLAIIEKHLAQYKSHWQANADVIFCFQAGFVGQYGEWYYTDNFGNHVPEWTSLCSQMLDTALKAIPQDRTLLLRRPMFKMSYLDGVALTEEEAYTGTKKARLGHFNDAFLYEDDNMGTYSKNATIREQQRALIAQETLYVPIGGETDIDSDSLAYARASYDSTITEMSTLHWTFIKSGYSHYVTDKWRTNGTFDELNRRLGYRYQLVSGTYGEETIDLTNPAAKTIDVNIQLKNLGFAPLYNERHAYIVLKNENAAYPLQLSVDPRTWKPGNTTYVINPTLTVPDTVYNGTYDLYLWLPDEYESLRNKPAYAIRLANEDVWDAESGMNALGAQVTVTGGEDAPAPVDTSIPLPATLNKENVESYSDDMTWYGEEDEYFDYEVSSSGSNLSRWAEWKVRLRYPGNYIVSEVMKSVYTTFLIGHSWQLLLISQHGDTASSYRTADIWKEGNLTYDAKWDLSGVDAGVYTLQIKNALGGARPKLKSLTLTYDGDIPSSIDTPLDLESDGQMYDILGRPVDESYRGVIIMRGKKILR